MENPELHPFLRFVDDARKQAREEDYDNSIKSYDYARREIEDEITKCHDVTANQKWNRMLKDVCDERESISRIKKALSKVLSSFNYEPEDRTPGEDGDGESVVAPHYHDAVQKKAGGVKRLNPPERRAELPNRGIRKHVSPVARAHVPPPMGVNGQKANVRPRVMVDKPLRPSKPRVNVSAPKKVAARRGSAGPSFGGKGNDQKGKDKLDPATNPLVQQIIDMGILVREPNVQWDSIAGLASVKRLLRQNLVILPMRPDIAKGLLAPWKSVLFYGPPGTGKTFLAKAVATECKRTFFNITSATITSRFLGESEKLVNHLFALADQMAPSTIFFDEIDSVASQRGSGNEHEASRRMKAELLTQLEGIDGASDKNNVFVLAATNFPWDLDEALLRRFQKRIYIPLPDVEGRLAILKMSISDNVDDSFDFNGFATKLEGYSCADITNLCRDAVQTVFNKLTSMMDTQEWLNMPAEAAKIVVKNEDFELAMKKRHSSVDAASLKKYEEWRLSKGAE